MTIAAQAIVTTSTNRSVKAHATEHLRTPDVVLERVRGLGEIGLDPCGAPGSSVWARLEWHGAEYELEDGLVRDWGGHGLVYCFPPPRDAARWAEKISREAAAGVEIVGLLASRTNEGWLHDHVFATAAAVCYWRGPLCCVGEKRRRPEARLVAYWGPRVVEFRDAFASAGVIVLGRNVHRPPSWLLSVPRPSPVGAGVEEHGQESKAVKGIVFRFAEELSFANATVGCPQARGPRRVTITRYGILQIAQESLERGGALVEGILLDLGLVCEAAGYAIEWRQAIDRRRPRTDIEIREG